MVQDNNQGALRGWQASLIEGLLEDQPEAGNKGKNHHLEFF